MSRSTSRSTSRHISRSVGGPAGGLRRAALAAAAAGAAVATALAPGAAAAAPAAATAQQTQQAEQTQQRQAWQCDGNYVCLYELRGGAGDRDQRCQYTRSQHDLTRGSWACRFAPRVGSVYNRLSSTVRLYERTGCAGSPVATVGAGKKASDITRSVRSVRVGNSTC